MKNAKVNNQRIIGQSQAIILSSIEVLGPNAFGAEMQRHIYNVTGRELSFGQIYTTLDRLEDKGFITSSVTDPEPIRGGRRRRVFQLEDKGVKALDRYASVAHAVSSSRGDSIEPGGRKGFGAA